MKKEYTTLGISARIWVLTVFFAAIAISVLIALDEGIKGGFNMGMPILIFVVGLIITVPALIAMIIMLYSANYVFKSVRARFFCFIFTLLIITIPYAMLDATVNIIAILFRHDSAKNFLQSTLITSVLLFISSLIALAFNIRPVFNYLSGNAAENDSLPYIFRILFNYTSKTNNNMETQHYSPSTSATQPNRILIKGLVTGGLILLMLIPTIFISNLVSEREARQKEVVKEVSSKWANAQTLSGPFLVVPYTDAFVDSDGKTISNKTKLLLLANDLNVNGKIIPEERPRSIYKVLLYKTALNMNGSFKVNLPADIQAANVDFANARICFTLSDFKGIEEEIYVNFNGQKLLLSPGLPVDDFGNVGLSVPVSLTPEMIAGNLPFSMQVKIKGSEELHFTPLAATSKYTLSSNWPGASFNGDMLPGERQVGDSGFVATWNFNQANLPYPKVMKTNSVTGKSVAFGVSLVQTTDQYDKTMRSVKYAILFVGLTFAFFLIIELMQKKPFHPVQYVLVGIALVIFYTLLLSISEYILFNHAYIIASLATILLISFYAKAHFNSWKTGGIFFALLSCLYAFIFILISLEDTALLVGSIGLFIVLALVMFASRRINWYGTSVNKEKLIVDN